jgi:hypothetical protein
MGFVMVVVLFVLALGISLGAFPFVISHMRKRLPRPKRSLGRPRGPRYSRG